MKCLTNKKTSLAQKAKSIGAVIIDLQVLDLILSNFIHKTNKNVVFLFQNLVIHAFYFYF